MDVKRFVTGTVVGGVVLFGLGYLIFDMVFGTFYATNAGSATGVMRDAPAFWAVVVGSLFQAALLTVAIGWAGASSVGAGFRIGAIVGFLAAASVDFIMFGIANISNLTATLVDPLLSLVHAGVGGAVIAAVAGKRAATA